MAESLSFSRTSSFLTSNDPESRQKLSPDSTLAFIASLGVGQLAVLMRHRLVQELPNQRTLREACAEAAVDPMLVLGELVRGLASEDFSRARWGTRPLRELTRHITNEHHTFARAACRRIHPLLAEVASRYRKQLSRLGHLVASFEQFSNGLEARLTHETRVVFPYVHALERHRYPLRAGQDSPLADSGLHERALLITSEMASLTESYLTRRRARPSVHTLYFVLAEVRRDLLLHVALEEKVLFPRARALEAKLRAERH